MSIINAYAPMEVSSSDIRDEFYDKLDEVCNNCPRGDVKIIVRKWI